MLSLVPSSSYHLHGHARTPTWPHSSSKKRSQVITGGISVPFICFIAQDHAGKAVNAVVRRPWISFQLTTQFTHSSLSSSSTSQSHCILTTYSDTSNSKPVALYHLSRESFPEPDLLTASISLLDNRTLNLLLPRTIYPHPCINRLQRALHAQSQL